MSRPRRCNAECWFAKQEQCNCICGGINHGKIKSAKSKQIMKVEFTFTGAIPSKKNSYQIGNGKFFSSPKVNEWTDTNIVLLRDQLNKQKVAMEDVDAQIKFAIQFNNWYLDIDNKLNTIFDMLQKGHFILNDMNFYDVHAVKPKKGTKTNSNKGMTATCTLEWEE
jgi:Holliday junction resolvase RusA-like endonuclease